MEGESGEGREEGRGSVGHHEMKWHGWEYEGCEDNYWGHVHA